MKCANVLRCIMLSVMALLVPTPSTVGAQQRANPQTVYFPQSGHQLDNRYGFLDYWRANGQVLRFGYPVSGVVEENGRPVQYFERARMEYHAEHAGTPYAVLIGLLGRELTSSRQFPLGPAVRGRLFPQTGYTVFGKFLEYWTTWGGLPVFGYPISESYVEKMPDGQTLAVQWFERARLEYHPEAEHPFFKERERANGTSLLSLYEIQMGQLGREAALRNGIVLDPTPRVSGVPDWSPALWPQRIEVDLSEQRLSAFEGDLHVFSAPVSTGKDAFETVTGTFRTYAKLLYDDMTGTLQGEEYDVRKVPHVLYFHKGYALHGTYWHEQFGTGRRVSHGCVNLPLDRAEWLWNWAQPAWDPAHAQRAAQYEPLQPETEAEAELQPFEGLAIFRPGTVVIVRK